MDLKPPPLGHFSFSFTWIVFWIQLENLVIALTAENNRGDDDFNLNTT